jgi:hypothetical protein
MEGDKSLDYAHEASANVKAEEHSETDNGTTGRPTVQYRVYKRRFAGLVALVSKGCSPLPIY